MVAKAIREGPEHSRQTRKQAPRGKGRLALVPSLPLFPGLTHPEASLPSLPSCSWSCLFHYGSQKSDQD